MVDEPPVLHVCRRYCSPRTLFGSCLTLSLTQAGVKQLPKTTKTIGRKVRVKGTFYLSDRKVERPPNCYRAKKQNFPLICSSQCNRGSAAARRSHHAPVPSGELSSITSKSTSGANRNTSSTNRGRFSISL